MGVQPRTAQETIALLAGQAHGVVTRAELLSAGLSRKQIEHRLGSGALRPIHRGVYRAGHEAPNVLADYLGAVRAAGPRALLAGRAAAHAFEILRGRAPRPEVVSPTERRIPGVTTRRTRRLHPLDAAVWRGIPTLTVAAVLVDLAAVMALDDLARAAHEAGVRYRTTPRQVEAVLARRPNATGAARLRSVTSGAQPVSLSRLESRFLERLREIDRPPPVTNRPAGGRRVDCRWPDHRLTVELDSYGFHNSRHSWERDHSREREAYARGDRFRRYTYGDVLDDPAAMFAELSCLLPREGVRGRTASGTDG